MIFVQVDLSHQVQYTCAIMPRKGNLVIYKNKAALIRAVADKILIETSEGTEVKVREKDITLLHAGPVSRFGELEPESPGELEEAWEVLEGTETTIEEIAELAFGENSPAAAWSVWQFVQGGSHFKQTDDGVVAMSAEEVEEIRGAAQAAEEAATKRQEFLARLKTGKVIEEDRPFLKDVEALAMGQVQTSKTLKEIGRKATPDSAHALLLAAGVWDHTRNPHPSRLGCPMSPPTGNLGDRDDADRTDLTSIRAFAIDDEGTSTPDDAVSIDDDGSLWVHVADPASLIPLDSPSEQEARARGASLYLPDTVVDMIPREAVALLGLGLQERSPALSFKIELDGEKGPKLIEAVPSFVRVERLTYTQADEILSRLSTEPHASAGATVDVDTSTDAETEALFARIYENTRRYRRQRRENDGVFIELPEAKILADASGTVTFIPIYRSLSRILVQESMVMCGQAVARWASGNGLYLPYIAQDPPDKDPFDGVEGFGDYEPGVTEFGYPELEYPLSVMYGARRKMKRSRRTTVPDRHAGLGIDTYAQVTSPLRRYQDLLCHYQIRAFILGQTPLDAEGILARIGEVDAAIPNLRKAENLSVRHWTLAALGRDPDWTGEAVPVEKRGNGYTVILPEIGLEETIFPRESLEFDVPVRVTVTGVDLPHLAVTFEMIDPA